MMYLISKSLRKIISKLTKNYYRKKMSKKYNGNNCSIFSSNCIGGIISNRIGQPHNSPTVNLWFLPRDFIKFISNPNKYIENELVFINQTEYTYPVGKIDDIRIFFQHYQTKEEALDSWEKRKKRVIYDNLFIIMYEQDLLREELQKLKDIKCKKLIVLTSKTDNLDLPFMKYIEKDNHGRDNAREFLDFDFLGRRTFEKQWDYISWLNE